MRKPFVAGNWKMNKTAEQATLLASDLLSSIKNVNSVECVICPPFTSLMVISQMMNQSGIGVGAQDMFWEASGAFTGEVAPAMVKEFCRYVILGHSERRALFCETDESVNRKVKAAIEIGLTPIMCVGETLKENESGKTAEIVERQVRRGLQGINGEAIEKIVLAYEPVWAIGTGRAASTDDAQGVIGGIIRTLLTSLYGEVPAHKVRIVYGGSVTSSNAAELFRMPDIDGALVGGASLKPDEFVKIVNSANK